MKGILRFSMAAICAAFFVSCTPLLPPLEPPPQRKTVVPQTDIQVDPARILESHNVIRRQLGVSELRWSQQMAAYATEWALFLAGDANCTLGYRGSIGLPLHKNGLGENLYIHDALVSSDGTRRVTEVDDRAVVVSWARQAEHFDYVQNTCALNQRCDNYTQVVWADSEVIGCGAASCGDKRQIWVCNYDPPGNFSQQRPY